MEVIALQSGSSGNCIYVSAAGKQFLFDAGISGRQAEMRLAQHTREIRDVDALIVSHDHRDHVCSMGVFQRKFDIPIHITSPTLAAAQAKTNLGRLRDVRFFRSTATIDFGEVQVETIRTPHDAVDGVAFVVDDGVHRLGIMTDLGHVFDSLVEVVATLDAVILESNHDHQLLAGCAYPELLKRRIRGPRGHISNHDAAALLQQAASPRMQWACLAHLSAESNSPEVAVATHRALLGDDVPIHCAYRDRASEVMEIHAGRSQIVAAT